MEMIIIAFFGNGSSAAKVGPERLKKRKVFCEAVRERRGDVGGGRGRDGSDPVSLFAKGVDAFGRLLAGSVPVWGSVDRKSPSPSRIR